MKRLNIAAASIAAAFLITGCAGATGATGDTAHGSGFSVEPGVTYTSGCVGDCPVGEPTGTVGSGGSGSKVITKSGGVLIEPGVTYTSGCVGDCPVGEPTGTVGSGGSGSKVINADR